MTESFLAAIQKSSNHSALDIWVLFVQHSLPGYKSKVETLWRRKTQNGSFPVAIVHKSLEAANGALADYFHCCTSVAGMLARAPDICCRKAGQALYVSMFRSFSEDFQRQEILSVMVTHTGSSSQHEMNTALEALLTLSSAGAGPHNMDYPPIRWL